jgi:NAD(P)-dependent dehydrogenase (short-subunit alcohol dehydrogenase family)
LGDGIRVNNVMPDPTLTPRRHAQWEREARLRGTTQEALALEQAESLPLGRHILPGEVADLVAYLCSPRADAITGAEHRRGRRRVLGRRALLGGRPRRAIRRGTRRLNLPPWPVRIHRLA